jgi:hypothetical protein
MLRLTTRIMSAAKEQTVPGDGRLTGPDQRLSRETLITIPDER